MHVMNVFDQEGFVSSKTKPAKFQSSFKEMADVFGAKKLGFHLKIQEPKTFSFPYHWHTGEEELVLILEGEATVRCNNEFRKVKAGDLVFYGTGPESVHHMYNHTDKPVKYFVLSNMNPENDQCFYPDSKKESSQTGYMQNGNEVDYYKDEEDPSVYWPKDRL